MQIDVNQSRHLDTTFEIGQDNLVWDNLSERARKEIEEELSYYPQ